jgi:hypothetical protein
MPIGMSPNIRPGFEEFSQADGSTTHMAAPASI